MSSTTQAATGAQRVNTPDNDVEIGADDVVVAFDVNLEETDLSPSEVRYVVEKALKRHPVNADAIAIKAGTGDQEEVEVIADRFNLPVAVFNAQWEDTEDLPEYLIGTREDGTEYNKQAGQDQTRRMIQFADAVIAIEAGDAYGVRGTVNTAKNFMGNRRIYHLVWGGDESGISIGRRL